MCVCVCVRASPSLFVLDFSCGPSGESAVSASSLLSIVFHCYSCHPLLSQGKTISPCGVFVLIGALKQAGHNAADLKEAQFTATLLKGAQFPAGQLQHAGFDLAVFCEAAQDYETCRCVCVVVLCVLLTCFHKGCFVVFGAPWPHMLHRPTGPHRGGHPRDGHQSWSTTMAATAKDKPRTIP